MTDTTNLEHYILSNRNAYQNPDNISVTMVNKCITTAVSVSIFLKIYFGLRFLDEGINSRKALRTPKVCFARAFSHYTDFI